jgi:formylglycine-generating enzyme required for sulfatase activity
MTDQPRTLRLTSLVLTTLLGLMPLAGANSAEMQRIDGFSIDRTEVSVGQFRQFVTATGTVTKAEKTGGGLVYGAGWERKAGLDLVVALRNAGGRQRTRGACDL